MKKILYLVVLIAELFVGSLLMGALWNSSMYISIAVAVIAFVGVLTWQIVALVKSADVSAKRKALLRIALAALIPTAVFVATYIIVAISFIIAFSFGGF